MEITETYFWVLGIFCVSSLVLLILRKFLWNHLEAFAGKAHSSWDGHALRALRSPTKVLTVVIALVFSTQFAGFESIANHRILIIAKILLVVNLAWILSSFSKSIILFSNWSNGINSSARSFLLASTRALIFSIAALIALDSCGISITPILASLGVGSIAVALALQDTLGNLFSGFYLLIDKPLTEGHSIRTEDGTEGRVEKIGWRSTRILTAANNVVVIPNSRLASSRVTNYDLGSSETTILIPIGVDYSSDLHRVEAVLEQVAVETQMDVPGGVRNFQPIVRFQAFGDSSINLVVTMRVQRISDQDLLRHKFIIAVHERFRKEGIEIPFPQRMVHEAKS